MSQTPHDEWAKNVFQAALAQFGHVQLQTSIAGEVRYADLTFEPAAEVAEATADPLTNVIRRFALLEFFHNPPSDKDMQSCMVKLVDWPAELRREKHRGVPSEPEVEARNLWVVTPTASKQFLQRNNATLDPEATWPTGVYRAPRSGLNIFIVVVHELPEIPETLVFRLVGRGAVRRRALVELAERPENDSFRRATLPGLTRWIKSVQSSSEPLDDAQKELLMNAQPLLDEYEKMERRLRAEGEAKGKAEGLLMVLEARGFSLSDVVRQRIQKCTDASELKHWFQRAVQISTIDELFA